ncbi:MAG: aspartate aminotransferase family protein [Tannerella sp.]|jgi:4-aminobutyrate aminotransferase|nr:aspartate aminotransferase family protein [Tannerella sp.]
MSVNNILEEELAKLNYSEAPLLKTVVPGQKTLEYLRRSEETESMARGGGRLPFIYEEARGSTVKDVDGNILIDITAGVAVSSVGRCHPRVIEAMREQMFKIMHASDLGSKHRTLLAEKVASIMPNGLRNNCITYFTQTGSGAVETAMAFARKITGRSQFVAFQGAYHGIWTSSGSLTTGDQYRKGTLKVPGVIHALFPYYYRFPFKVNSMEECENMCADYLDTLLNTPYTGANDVAAVILEPIQGEGGYIPLSPQFIERVKAACEKNGCLYIDDEVQAGAGRSGKMWVLEHTSVTPDILTWGKGMGSDMPMAGCSIRRDLAKCIEDGSQPNTFAANGVAAAACMTNIDILTENDRALLSRVSTVGTETLDYLKKAQTTTPFIGEVRGKGFMIGIELVADKTTKQPLDGQTVGRLIGVLLNNGVIMVPCGRYGNVFRFMPPLTITRDLIKKSCDALIESLNEVASL